MTLVKTPQASGRWRRWLTWAGVVFLPVLVIYAVRAWDYWGRDRGGMSAMERGEYGQAAEVFARQADAYPQDKEAAFLAAVAYRRAGNADRFDEYLKRAEGLGFPADAIRLQRLLEKTQHGLADRETEEALNRICEAGTDDDFVAEQIYEARAKGYMSVYRLDDAFLALGHWIDWQPHAIVPRLLRAQLYEDNDDVRRAEEDYRAVIEGHPDHLACRFNLAETLVVARRHDEAREHYAVCERLSPGNPRGAVGLAEIEFRSGGDLDQVVKSLTELLKGKLDQDLKQRTWIVLSNIYRARKENEKVVALLEDAAARGELDVPTFQVLMRAYTSLNQRDKAQHYLKLQERNLARRDRILMLHEQVRAVPENPVPRYRLGNEFSELGNKEGALTWWYTAILAEPMHQQTHEALAKHFATAGDAAKAAHHRELAEKSVERTFRLAWRDIELNDFDALRFKLPFIQKYPAYKPHAELLELALKVKEEWGKKPQDRVLADADLEPLYELGKYPHLRKHAQTALGGGLFALGNMGAAEKTLLEVIQNDPNFIEAHRWLLSINFDIRAFDHAKFHADAIAKLDPGDFRPHRLLGLMAKVMQSWDLAIASYQQALRRNSKPEVRQEILMELGECQTRSRKYPEALKTLEDVAESAERNLLVAECLFHTGRANEATPLLDATLKRDPRNPAANLLKADCILEQKGDLEVARQHVQTILDQSPFSDSAWFKLSQIYGKLNKQEDAKKASERATELRDLQIQYSRLIEVAVSEAENLEVRVELEAIARQFGRTDLADEWARAIELLKAKKALGDGAAPAAPRRVPVLVTPEDRAGAARINADSPTPGAGTVP